MSMKDGALLLQSKPERLIQLNRWLRGGLAGVLKSWHQILFWPKQVLQGFYLKENWKKFYLLTSYPLFVGLAINSTDLRENRKQSATHV